MERYNLILQNKDFLYYMDLNNKSEKNRIFCKHNLEHSLDVARISYIMVLEKKLNFSKDVIYATAFLHDIGKFDQVINQNEHEKTSAKISEKILKDCGYLEDEISFIINIILKHRKLSSFDENSFENIFYQADKKSRLCFNCSAKKECNWSDEKKNLNIIY